MVRVRKRECELRVMVITNITIVITFFSRENAVKRRDECGERKRPENNHEFLRDLWEL